MNPLHLTSFGRPPARFDIPSDSQAIGSAAFAIPDERHEDIGTEEDCSRSDFSALGRLAAVLPNSSPSATAALNCATFCAARGKPAARS